MWCNTCGGEDDYLILSLHLMSILSSIFFNNPSTTELYTLSLHDALPIYSDRLPWLQAIRGKMNQWVADGRNVALACSALKRIYREQLCTSPEVKLVYLKGTYEEIYTRLSLRTGHFASQQLLASQFAVLEEPSDAVIVDVNRSPEDIVAEICRQLVLAPAQIGSNDLPKQN